MAKVHGTDSVFTLNSNELTAYLTDVSFSWSKDVAETSTMGDRDKSYLPGLKDSTITLTGRFDSTATTGPDAVLSAAMAADTADTWIYGPEGDTTGDVKYSGSGQVTAYEVSSPLGDIVAFTATIQVSGGITEGTFA